MPARVSYHWPVAKVLRLACTRGTCPLADKEALNAMGVDVGPHRAPVGPLAAKQRAALKKLPHENKVL